VLKMSAAVVFRRRAALRS